MIAIGSLSSHGSNARESERGERVNRLGGSLLKKGSAGRGRTYFAVRV